MTKTTFTIRSVSFMSKTFSNKDIFSIFSNDKFYWLSCWEDQQTKEPPGHCRWLDSPQRSFCFPFPPHWRQERVGGLVQEEIHLVDHLRSPWAQTWWHRCLWGWISCLESPGQKNFEKREVFPTLAEPNKSTMNSSDGQSPDFLNMERLAKVSVLEDLNTDVWKIFGIAINQSNIIYVDWDKNDDRNMRNMRNAHL